MMGTLEKLSHAELTNTPPNTAHARVAAIQHNLQLQVKSHVQSLIRVSATGVFDIHLSRKATCHVLQTVHLNRYWSLVHLLPAVGKCDARQSNQLCRDTAYVAFARLV